MGLDSELGAEWVIGSTRWSALHLDFNHAYESVGEAEVEAGTGTAPGAGAPTKCNSLCHVVGGQQQHV